MGVGLVGNPKKVWAKEDLPTNSFEISNPSPRATVRYHFNSIPPLKYKGKTCVDYYPYDAGDTGVCL